MRLWTKIKKNQNKMDTWFWNIVNRATFFLNGVKCGKKLQSRGKVHVYNAGTVQIGKKCRINSANWANPIGSGHKVWLQILQNGELKIGDNVGISNVGITCAEKIEIGNNVMIGSGTKIYDTDFHAIPFEEKGDFGQVKTAPIKIEDNVFIGADAIILKGSKIGKGSVVGAGAVVAGEIPPHQIWGGNPAKYIRSISACE